MAVNDKMMVRLLSRGFTIISQMMACFEAPKGMQDAMNFTSKNLDRIASSNDEKTWKDVRIRRTVPLDTLTNLGIELHWMSMKLNTYINAYRKITGYKTVDFQREAIEYDLKVEKGDKDINDRRA
jgi:hypothetical protein